jgi:hypothetical protein
VARYKKMRLSDFKIATDGVIGFELSERDLYARRRRVVARAGLHRERARTLLPAPDDPERVCYEIQAKLPSAALEA